MRAQPILRARVIETLSTRFKSRVELGELHVWIANGVHVEGGGLKIYGATDPNPWEAGVQPLLEIGCEELPASFVRRAYTDLLENVTSLLSEAGVLVTDH